MIDQFFTGSLGQQLITGLRIVWAALPFVMPVACVIGLYTMWLSYRRTLFWEGKGSLLLEIKLPREIFKSPLAMEIVLGTLYQTSGETTWIDRAWKGQTRPWFSLELVSIGGKIHFYIWTWPQYKNLIESQIYGQYPGVEVHQVEDYMLPFYYDPAKNNVWACEYALTKPDPFPIKTYIDYGLDKDPKEELKVDPMTSLLEFLGSLTEGHNVFIQIMIRAHKKMRKFEVFGETNDPWKDTLKKEVDTYIAKVKGTKEEPGRRMTKVEEEIVSALERSASKFPYDVGIRSLYIADKDKFTTTNFAGLTGGFKQYSSQSLNGFKPAAWFTIFDYPWQDPWERKREKLKKMVIEEYKRRRYFYSTYRGKNYYSNPFTLNVEELATIFHFPGAVASTPTFERIPSKKSEAPANLPI